MVEKQIFTYRSEAGKVKVVRQESMAKHGTLNRTCAGKTAMALRWGRQR